MDMNSSGSSLRRIFRAGMVTALAATALVVSAPTGGAQSDTGTVTGTVLSSGGTPVEGATVYVMDAEPGMKPWTATTAADGTFTVADVYPDEWVVMALPPAGSSDATSAMGSVVVTAGSATAVGNISLTTATVTGTVTSTVTGTSVAAAGVWVVFMEMGMQGPAEGGENMTITDADGNYSLGPLSGMFMALAYDPATGTMTAPAQAQLTGTAATQDFVFTPPNITGTVTKPDGTAYENAFAIALSCDSDFYAQMNQCMVTGEGGFGATGADGTFTMSIPGAGTYMLQIEPQHGDTTVGMHSEIFTLAEAGEEKAFTIQLVAPNVTGTVTNPNTGAGAEDVWVMAFLLGESGYPEGPPSGEGPTGENGQFAMTLTTAGTYLFMVEIPWFNSSLTGLMGLNQNVAITGDAQVVDFTLGVPNFSGTFMKDETNPVKWGWVNICKSPGTNWQLHCMSYTDSGGGMLNSNIGQTGGIDLQLDPYQNSSQVGGETWRLWLYPDEYENAGVAKTGIDVELNSDNTAVVSVKDSSGNEINAGSDGKYTITAAEPNLTGTVIDPTTSSALSTSGHDRGHICAEDRTNWTWDCSNVSSTGTFGINLDDATYTVHVEPPHGSTTMSKVSFTATVSGGVVTASGAAASQSAAGAAVTVTLGTPNLIGTMQKSGEGAGDGHLAIQTPQDENNDGDADWWSYSAGIHISREGAFATELSQGTYKLTAEPGWNLSGASPVDAYVDVAANGDVSCNTTIPEAATDACNISSGSLVMSWGTPNFQAMIYNPNTEAGEIDGGLDIEQWYQSNGTAATSLNNAAWSRWVTWGNGGTTGIAELTLDNGVYNVKTRPGWGTADLAGDDFTVVVVDNAVSSCQTTASTPANCSTSSGAYVLPLATPNFSGTAVKADTSAATWAHVSVMQWKDSDDDGDIQKDQCCDHPEWITGASARPATVSGQTVAKFGLSLADGDYEIDLHPSWEDSTSIRRSFDITVASGSVTSCTPSAACTSSDGQYQLALATSNVTGALTDSDNNAVTYSFVDVMKNADGNNGTGENGYEAFVTWGDVNNEGAFSLYLDQGTYQLAAFPPWSDTTHQRTLVTLVVDSTPAVTSCTTAQAASCLSNGAIAVQLAKGNYSGTIKSSDTGNPALENALVMLVDGSGDVITDSLTNSDGIYYLNISDDDITNNSCTSNNVCDLKVQPASLAVGSAVDKTTSFELGTLSTGQTAASLGDKTLDAAD